jgi:hypothetical protein
VLSSHTHRGQQEPKVVSEELAGEKLRDSNYQPEEEKRKKSKEIGGGGRKGRAASRPPDPTPIEP